MHDPDDQVFWDRLAEMPFAEQEQECVLRREHLLLRLAVLQSEKVEADAAGRKLEARRIGVAYFEDGAQLSVLNERIKYLRRVMDSIGWRKAVRTVLGEDAYAAVQEWRVAQEADLIRAGYPCPRST